MKRFAKELVAFVALLGLFSAVASPFVFVGQRGVAVRDRVKGEQSVTSIVLEEAPRMLLVGGFSTFAVSLFIFAALTHDEKED